MIDLYVFFVTRSLFNYSSSRSRNIYTVAYWSVAAIVLILLFALPYLQFIKQNSLLRSTIFALVFALFFAKIIAVLFFLIDDVRRGVQWTAGKVFAANNEISEVAGTEGKAISRSSFLTWAGIVLGGSLFSTFVYGLSNRYNYNIKRVRLAFHNLPAAFKGLKIVQISDIHSGSFTSKEAVIKGIDKILNERPDVILFTGDLVNNRSDEMEGYLEIFSRLKAPMGVYSILGNHDYGDYFTWDNLAAKAANLNQLKLIHEQLGWRLMLNENLPLEKNGDKIGLVGVENISGNSRFHSYGNMEKAMQGAEQYPFKILMSHDPSHWDKEVNTKYLNEIDLMLSGHTHGMQFGIEIPGFRWSPVQYVYKQWAGLYEKGSQKLYINRGFGFIGYPGRVAYCLK